MKTILKPYLINGAKIIATALYLSICVVVPISFANIAVAAPAKQVVEAHKKVSLNTASVEELSRVLSGIGIKKAQAIVAFREKHGGFKHIDEIVEVKGIGDKTLEKNKHRLSL